MELIFLGTGSMIPTRERNHIAMLLKYKDESILIDCGEGTQRQFRLVKISPTIITKVLITHLHGDHILGLAGLLITLGVSNYSKILKIYGPKGIKDLVDNIRKYYLQHINIKLEINEILPERFFENNDFILEAKKLDHPTLCFGYSFIEKDKRKINLDYLKKFGLKQHPILKRLQNGKDIIWEGKKILVNKATKLEKGKKITFILDTKYHDNIIKLSKNADLLVCESTHLDELKEKTEK